MSDMIARPGEWSVRNECGVLVATRRGYRTARSAWWPHGVRKGWIVDRVAGLLDDGFSPQRALSTLGFHPEVR